MGALPPADVRRTLKTPADYVRVLESRAPASPPGAEYQYSNYGYILLAAIVERASGMTLQDYLQRRVFGPAGMIATSIGAPPGPQAGRAPGYRQQAGQWVRASADDVRTSGEPFSTAADLLRFARALDSGRLISKQLLDRARTPPPNGRYGYGLLIADHGPFTSYGHSGTGGGVNADVRIVPRGGYVVIGLSNFEQPAAGRMVDFFLNRMPAM
jgi:CubicO group peptidase (beta-lactamase class C family)